MKYEHLLELCTGDVTFTDESGYQYTLNHEERKMLSEAVRKQIPKKPISYMDGSHKRYRCPKCSGEDGYDIEGVWYIKHQFCPDCGQRIDWSEAEE